MTPPPPSAKERAEELWRACQRRTGGHGPCGVCQMCRAAAALTPAPPPSATAGLLVDEVAAALHAAPVETAQETLRSQKANPATLTAQIDARINTLRRLQRDQPNTSISWVTMDIQVNELKWVLALTPPIDSHGDNCTCEMCVWAPIKVVPGLREHYSGENSKAFWDVVNATNNDSLYILGCALQDLESRVLQLLPSPAAHTEDTV